MNPTNGIAVRVPGSVPLSKGFLKNANGSDVDSVIRRFGCVMEDQNPSCPPRQIDCASLEDAQQESLLR